MIAQAIMEENLRARFRAGLIHRTREPRLCFGWRTEEMELWPVEEIPDEDSLFYRVPVAHLRPDLKTFPGMFRENKGSISTDWERYSTASETRARQGRPERFAVLRLVAGAIREIDGLTVLHSPTPGID